jgi:hypothetical protein
LFGAALIVFAALGFADRLAFFSTRGQVEVLGLSSNGLLSTISVIVALVLLAAAARSPRTASTVMIVLGPLFLLSAFVNSLVLSTRLNLLGFEVSNVIFSVVVGLFLLLLGAYGRISGHLPPDSPYAHPPADVGDVVDERPRTPAEAAAEQEMREAEIAVVQHTATPEQYRRVQAMARVHTRAERRAVWMQLSEAAARDAARRDVPPPGRRGRVPHPRAARLLHRHAAGPSGK